MWDLNPNEPQISMDLEAFNGSNKGPIQLLCGQCVLTRPTGSTWLTVNCRALSSGALHSPVCPFCKTNVRTSASSCVSQLKATLAESENTVSKLEKEVAEKAATINELKTDLDPWHAKFGRWERGPSTHPTGQTKAAFREWHEEMKAFEELMPSSQYKFLTLHFQPRMEAIFYLCGGTRESFTAALGLWIAKHTFNVSWVGSRGCKYKERFVTSYIDLLSTVPEVWESEEKRILSLAQNTITTREMIRVIDRSGLSRDGTDVWRHMLGSLPSKNRVLEQRKVFRARKEASIGEWQRAEREVTTKDGKSIVNEFY